MKKENNKQQLSVGHEIKLFAKVWGTIGIILSVVIGLISIFVIGPFAAPIVIFLGIILSIISKFMLMGYGQIVCKMEEMTKSFVNIERELHIARNLRTESQVRQSESE